jgi:NAD(P)-dependent dehydrogenase (short-subunit alcohol dehydrogenase family)
MIYNFNNKTVLITGGASGIGLEIANRYFELNANIIICGRDKGKFQAAMDSILQNNPNKSGKLLTYRCDMSCEKDVIEMVNDIKSKSIEINILVNNCSTWFLSSILDLKVTELDDAYNNILKSTIVGTKNIAAAMKNKSNDNSIVNISSFAGIMPQKNGSIYACLKAAIINFTKSSASELAGYGIRVNCVTPGVIKTDMTNEYIEKNRNKLLNPISMNRLGDMEEIANVVVFLSSKYADYINGENLCVTGGKYLIQE